MKPHDAVIRAKISKHEQAGDAGHKINAVELATAKKIATQSGHHEPRLLKLGPLAQSSASM